LKPDVEKIKNDPDYRKIEELNFDDMIPFILTHIRKRGIISLFYWAVNLFLITIAILYFFPSLGFPKPPNGGIFWQAVAGIFSGSILIIPIHELLHGLAYRMLGARKIIFGADMKQFIFYVTADRYPVSGLQLYFLAMTPFIVINAVVIVLTLLWLPQLFLFSTFLLLSHNVMCIGDFAIANYVSGHTPARIFTYDEPEIRKSYFYELLH
jgi:hypothetical protein